MRNAIDFSSWEGVLSTLVGLALFSLVVVGVRLLVMQTVQLRRERENRQINERLRTLIAAYKRLGGSFTGNLAVDPRHLRDLRTQSATAPLAGDEPAETESVAAPPAVTSGERTPVFERRRQIRDAVEAALSDVILLGTEEQVRLAARAVNDMVAGRAIETAELVVSLRRFIRDVLELDQIPADVVIPRQGPARPGSGASRSPREERSRGAARGGAGLGGGGGGAGGGIGIAGESDHGESSHDAP